LLVEPMNLLRRALATGLSAEDDFEVIGALADLEEALQMAREGHPDVLVGNVDLLLGVREAGLLPLPRELPDCALVALGAAGAPGAVMGELNARVSGFIGDGTAPDQLAAYIRQVAAGERVIDPALAVAAWYAPPNPLTARELEILRIAAKGAPPAEIAAT